MDFPRRGEPITDEQLLELLTVLNVGRGVRVAVTELGGNVAFGAGIVSVTDAGPDKHLDVLHLVACSLPPNMQAHIIYDGQLLTAVGS